MMEHLDLNPHHGEETGERCAICGAPARHKIGEENVTIAVHNLTTYVCCEHMKALKMDCEWYDSSGWYDVTDPFRFMIGDAAP